MAKIFIDTRDSSSIVVCLVLNGTRICKTSPSSKLKAQTTLPLIESLIREAKIKISDIEEIDVERGPGSFTGLRVGVSIANALSFSTLTKINGKPLGEIETVQY